MVIATSAVVAVSLIVGMIGTSWQAIRAEKERGRAVIAEGVAKERLEIVELQKEEINKERQKAIAEAERAKANYRRARSAVDEFLTKVTEDQLLSVPGLQPVQRTAECCGEIL